MKSDNSKFDYEYKSKKLNYYQNLNDLTVVIPSYSRQDYILRQVSYWHGSGAILIVIDGSEFPINHVLQDQIAKLNDVIYIHSNLKLTQRLRIASSLIKSKYTVYCSDDDFLLHSAISKAVNYLGNSPDVIACMGQSLRFDVLSNNKVTYGTCYEFNKFNLDSEDIEDRLIAATSNYAPITCHAVMRSEVWKKSWGNIPDYSSSQILEFYQAILVYFSGKLLLINDLYLLRTLENLPLSTLDANRKISSYEWWNLDLFSSEKEDFLNKLTHEGNQILIGEYTVVKKFMTELVNNLINNLSTKVSIRNKFVNYVGNKLNLFKSSYFGDMVKKITINLMPNLKRLNIGFLNDLRLVKNKNLLMTKETYVDLLSIEDLIIDFYKSGPNLSRL